MWSRYCLNLFRIIDRNRRLVLPKRPRLETLLIGVKDMILTEEKLVIFFKAKYLRITSFFLWHLALLTVDGT